jgi:hypothetical protein
MRTIYLLAVVFSSLLLTRATSHADDPKKASADFDLRQNKSVNERTLRARPPASVPITKASPESSRRHSPAIIGGPANKLKSAPVINGTGMKHKS